MSADDIATWLTAIWDEEEARLSHPTFCGPVWPTTDQLVARIAADRQILALHTNNDGRCEMCVTDIGVEYGDPVWEFYEHPCTTVRLLALPHADRPGYNEQWRP